MNVQAEVSLYPLRSAKLTQALNSFCEALRKNGVRVNTGNMSTSLSGELVQVFESLKIAMAKVSEDYEVVLVAKVSNACPEVCTSEHDAQG